MKNLINSVRSNGYLQFLIWWPLIRLFWQLLIATNERYSLSFFVVDVIGLVCGLWFVAVVENRGNMIYTVDVPSTNLRRYKFWQKVLIWATAILMWIPWVLILLIWLLTKKSWPKLNQPTRVLVSHMTVKYSGRSIPIHITIAHSSGYVEFTPTVYPRVDNKEVIINFKFGGPYLSITIYFDQIRQDITNRFASITKRR